MTPTEVEEACQSTDCAGGSPPPEPGGTAPPPASKPHGKNILLFVISLLPLLAAILLFLWGQIYDPYAQAGVIINVLLILLNVFNFLLLLKLWKSARRLIGPVGTACISLLAFLYNVCVRGTPPPLSDFKGFFNSMCGLWLLITVAEAVLFVIWAIRRNRRLVRSIDKWLGPDSGGGNGPGPNPPPVTPRRKPGRGKDWWVDLRAWGIFVFILVVAFALPFLPISWLGDWMESARGICTLVYGDILTGKEDVLVLACYLLLVFTGTATLVVLARLGQYMIAKCIRKNPDQSAEDFFEAYSGPISLIAVVTVVIIALRSENKGPGSGGVQVLGWFTVIIFVIVGIILIGLTLFELVRLVLKQCMAKGTLLKLSIHLIFVLVVQYIIELLEGTLRVFALRNVIESLLLFFIPDLEDSIDFDVKTVFQSALKKEVREIQEELQSNHAPAAHGHKRGGGFRIVDLRGRKQ